MNALPPFPPPPRSPGSSGSASYPQRRILVQPHSVATSPGGGREYSAGSPYRYTPSDSAARSPFSPYAPAAPSPLSPFSAGAESPLALRSASASMAAEYNPQQWGSRPTGVQYRPHGGGSLTIPTSIALDEAGQPLESPPPPYSPPPNQSIAQSLARSINTPARSPGGFTSPPIHTPPSLQTNLSSPHPSLAAEYASPASAITVISPLSGRNRNEPPPLSFPPPPGAASSSRDRSGSRSRFTLSSLTSRGRSTERSGAAKAIDTLHQNTRDALAIAPTSWGNSSPQPQPHEEQLTTYRRGLPPLGLPQASNRNTVYLPSQLPPAPPASRRSASTGAIGQQQQAPPPGQPTWTPGMPLPPPPPLPPSASSRSASSSRADGDMLGPTSVAPANSSVVPVIVAPTRRPPHRGTQLGPVPPTPLDWTEFPRSPGSSQLRQNSAPAIPIQSEASSSESSTQRTDPLRITTSTSVPSPPRRDSNIKPIKTRRSESRAARDRSVDAFRTGEQSNSSFVQSPEEFEARPYNLDLVSSSSNSGMSRQGAVKKSKASPIDSQRSIKSPMRDEDNPTPPFSPETERKDPFSRSPAIPPKALPTPPPQSTFSHEFLSPSASLGVRSSDERPVSHILHLPNAEEDLTKSPPLIPESTRRSSLDSVMRPDPSEAFMKAAIERHQTFVEQESRAASDMDRLRLFAEYLVRESRLRRDKYAAAFSSMDSSDVLDLTRDLWRANQPSPTTNQAPRSASITGPSTVSSRPAQPSRTDSLDSFASMSSPMSSHTNFTPQTEPESPASATSSIGARETRWARHQPQLSPIPSMAMSTVPDEQESRGRPASRWWESDDGASTGNAGPRLGRSKRESKYMGLHPDALANLQWQDEPSPSALSTCTPRRASGQFSGVYPPEKTGWHDENDQGPASTPTYFHSSVPPTPDPHKLDVARLVTLPPPYPRHYPANDNNHPGLATIRTTLDSLRDLADIEETKDKFRTKMSQRRDRLAKEAATRHAQMRHNIQQQLDMRQMTYATAAQAEEDFNAAEAQRAEQAIKQEYDSFQPEVMTPLYALVSERITKATACVTQLRSGLSSSAHDPSPNQPQEEGDEQPELLEKLNLLKWLFEARESLHKQLFDLEDEKNERYRELILTPFRNSSSPDAEAKARDAEQFFAQIRRERKVVFETATVKRFEDFAAVVGENVTRGVEDQLSAFWDIAPGLKTVVSKVPYQMQDLAEFEVQIPPREMEENPTYEHYPLQYLYSLLAHAEKSAYQFIESQVNQLCLLHEAQTGVMVAGIRLLETQRMEGEEGDAWRDVQDEMAECRKAEEERLRLELKEKVETVESQWREGLGSGIMAAKERVQDFLVEVGGWDEGLLE